MNPADVSASYNQIAGQWVSPEFNEENGVAAHRRALAFLPGDTPHGTALDLGCGAGGRLINVMLANGLKVEGLDLSERMLDLARNRHPDVIFHHADMTEWPFAQTYNFITAWDSFWHVPLVQQPGVLEQMLGALNPDGVCIFSSGGLDHAEERVDQAMGVPMYHATPGIPALLHIVGQSGCVLRHLEYDHHPELHIYIIAQKMPNP
ncbi:class I SAM-dependent methyltransferase [Marinihelvus fidelis]|uniref:Class I SAM-dependent methyltransferase n=1 Tax=Marinihelvus fidelis TaxID=2613842 RepID=A0A5N0T9Y1_9GAMM|nr:class I SAM-dependent methyltransferase [Marinihelvus fidelis]KAA9131825.1 class I SAM-dependent methyltransferase [Marinihelvus fidelis]